MSNVKIKLNNAGVRALLKSPKMRAICNEQAGRIANRCGDGYETQERNYPERVGTIVKAVTSEAIRDNSDNNTLLKAVRP